MSVRSCRFSALNPTAVSHLIWCKSQRLYNGLKDLTVRTSPPTLHPLSNLPQSLLPPCGFTDLAGSCLMLLLWMFPLPEFFFFSPGTYLLIPSSPLCFCLDVAFSKRSEFKTATVTEHLKPFNILYNLLSYCIYCLVFLPPQDCKIHKSRDLCLVHC